MHFTARNLPRSYSLTTPFPIRTQTATRASLWPPLSSIYSAIRDPQTDPNLESADSLLDPTPHGHATLASTLIFAEL